MQGRIGFCCKWIDSPTQVNGVKPLDECKQYNTGTTTISWLNRQKKEVAEQKLWDLMTQNIVSVHKLVTKVGQSDPALRMVRLSSDILPAYTESSWRYFWQQSEVRNYAETHFAAIGEYARANDIRLSFHPGQFCVLASDSADIVDRSIEEFEYHTDMARWMGYGKSWHDHGFKINVHLSGRGGITTFLQTLGRLSPESRNLITIENDENSNDLDYILAVGKHVALVMDIHHHWVKTGEYISPSDQRVDTIIESWRNHRPVLHYSVSREDILLNHPTGNRPDFATLIGNGHKKQRLRAHSDFFWNTDVNEWALTFLPQFDIQCEAKGKNLAAHALYQQAKSIYPELLTA